MTNRMTWAAVAVFGCASAFAGEAAQVAFDRLFGDHAVLQREKQVSVWGRGATPKGAVTVTVGASSASTLANADGTFLVWLPAQKAGGPYALEATDGASGGKAVSKDVYVGEVWVASGQSNMEFKMKNAQPAFPEGEHPLVRMFTVPRNASTVKVREAAADWVVAKPETVGGFSAVGGFFALELQKRLGCAVGILHTSWGGTRVEAWTSRESLLGDPCARPWMEAYERTLADPKLFEGSEKVKKANANPEAKAPLDPGIDPKAKAWADAKEPESTEWRDVALPTSFSLTFKRQFNGAVWYRRTLELPAEFVGQDLVLHVGQVDKHDRTFFNGEQVGATGKDREVEYWDKLRVYPVPARLVTTRQATVAVRVWSQIHAGAISGPEDELYIALKGDPSKRVSLAGEGWRARVERDIGFTFRWLAPPLVPGDPNAPHTLFDGMIEPILGCAIRGAIWYQGESNASVDRFAPHYGELMALMISDWRHRWGQGDFPFIQVELANFTPAQSYSDDCGWAMVRQGQVRATRLLPNVGVASAVDIGDAFDIHPKDKWTVGKRLARWAFANVYSLETVGCGPRFLSSSIEGDAIRVRFTDVGGGLVAKGSTEGVVAPCFVAGDGGKFVRATGRIEGATLVISSPEVKKPVRACYGWAANPLGLNLYNKEGLPASPFMTE